MKRTLLLLPLVAALVTTLSMPAMAQERWSYIEGSYNFRTITGFSGVTAYTFTLSYVTSPSWDILLSDDYISVTGLSQTVISLGGRYWLPSPGKVAPFLLGEVAFVTAPAQSFTSYALGGGAEVKLTDKLIGRGYAAFASSSVQSGQLIYDARLQYGLGRSYLFGGYFGSTIAGFVNYTYIGLGVNF